MSIKITPIRKLIKTSSFTCSLAYSPVRVTMSTISACQCIIFFEGIKHWEKRSLIVLLVHEISLSLPI